MMRKEGRWPEALLGSLVQQLGFDDPFQDYWEKGPRWIQSPWNVYGCPVTVLHLTSLLACFPSFSLVHPACPKCCLCDGNRGSSKSRPAYFPSLSRKQTDSLSPLYLCSKWSPPFFSLTIYTLTILQDIVFTSPWQLNSTLPSPPSGF